MASSPVPGRFQVTKDGSRALLLRDFHLTFQGFRSQTPINWLPDRKLGLPPSLGEALAKSSCSDPARVPGFGF